VSAALAARTLDDMAEAGGQLRAGVDGGQLHLPDLPISMKAP